MIADGQAGIPAGTDPAADQGGLGRIVLSQGGGRADQLARFRGPDAQDAGDFLGVPSLLAQRAYALETVIRLHGPDRKARKGPRGSVIGRPM